METAERTPEQARASFVARLLVGLAQGLALYFLYVGYEDKTWPATDGLIFAPLLFISYFAGLVLLFGIGNLRAVTLVIWAVVAAGLVAALAWYDIWRELPQSEQYIVAGRWVTAARILPSFAVCFFTSAGIFVAQALIAGGDADRRFRARYATHFDVAWKLGLQLLLAHFFVVIFWLLIFLGATLFHIIGIEYFRKLIEHRWFSIPATTLAFAAAVHLTDVRAGLVRGTRTLVLVLLSWLLPLMAVIGAGFLLSLFATGLAPLWKTGFAAGYLMIAAGTLVFLINAAFQDGAEDHRPMAILRLATTLACLLLIPLVLLSGYAIHLRVLQYGWTTERVGSIACLIVAASYAIGYANAAIPGAGWLARIAPWNFFTAILVLAVIGCIFSPLADPSRIAVNSQVERLISGKVDVARFDFHYLRWDAGRFGMDALRRLSGLEGSGRVADIRTKAKAALADKQRYSFYTFVAPTPAALAGNIAVYPKDRTLPQSFLKQDWSAISDPIPGCLRNAGVQCDAYLLPLSADGKPVIAVVDRNYSVGPYAYGNGLFQQQPDGRWKLVGRPSYLWSCKSTAEALQAGHFSVVPAAPPRWREVDVGGTRLTVQESGVWDQRCPQ